MLSSELFLLLALNLLTVHCLMPIETVAPLPEVASLSVNDETLYTVPHAYLFKILRLRFDTIRGTLMVKSTLKLGLLC